MKCPQLDQMKLSNSINKKVQIIRLIILFVLVFYYGDFLITGVAKYYAFPITGVAKYYAFPITGVAGYLYKSQTVINFHFSQNGVLFLKNSYGIIIGSHLVSSLESYFKICYNYTGIVLLNSTYFIMTEPYYLYEGGLNEILYNRFMLLAQPSPVLV
jgi:hypothetical protein